MSVRNMIGVLPNQTVDSLKMLVPLVERCCAAAEPRARLLLPALPASVCARLAISPSGTDVHAGDRLQTATAPCSNLVFKLSQQLLLGQLWVPVVRVVLLLLVIIFFIASACQRWISPRHASRLPLCPLSEA